MFSKLLALFTPQLLTSLRSGYSFKFLQKDFLAGLTVAIVALPLSMALAIASGTTPERGLFTAIVAGFFISFLGGSKVQIGGPTGAFVGLVLYTLSQFGFEGLLIATFLAGLILIVLGILRFGGVIKYIPYPVVLGFTLGIATILFSTQIKDFFGLTMTTVPSAFIEKWIAYIHAFPTYNLITTGLGLSAVLIIVLVQKYAPKWPAFLISVASTTFMSWVLKLPVETIGSKFGKMPTFLPSPDFSFLEKITDLSTLQMLFIPALTIAILAGVESLLSAVVADNMTKDKHKPDCELVAQGVANIASSIFGGLPATGAIARTALNVRSDAKSPLSGVFHALFVLIFMVAFASIIEFIPLSVLGGILFIVSWNMAGFKELKKLIRAPRSDQVILLTTFVLTILVDLTASITVGVLISAIFFMKQMANSTFIRQYSEKRGDVVVPKDVVVFDINGPFFFGATSQLQEKIENTSSPYKTCIIKMNHVQLLDISGIVALEDFLKSCCAQGIAVIFSNPTLRVETTLKRMKLERNFKCIYFATDLKNAFEIHAKKVGVCQE